MTKGQAIEHFGLSKAEYEQIITFINVNNLVGKQMLFVYPCPDGRLDVRLSAIEEVLTSPSSNIPSTSKQSEDKTTQSNKQMNQGSCFVDTTIQPGAAPRVQAHSTNSRVADATAIVSLIGLIAWAINQWCNLLPARGAQSTTGHSTP